VAEIEQPAQEAVLIGRRKRNACVQMGVTACPNTRPRRPYGRIVSRPMETTPRSDRSTATSRAMVHALVIRKGSNRH
jgi:hypothetical protein